MKVAAYDDRLIVGLSKAEYVQMGKPERANVEYDLTGKTLLRVVPGKQLQVVPSKSPAMDYMLTAGRPKQLVGRFGLSDAKTVLIEGKLVAFPPTELRPMIKRKPKLVRKLNGNADKPVSAPLLLDDLPDLVAKVNMIRRAHRNSIAFSLTEDNCIKVMAEFGG